MNTTHIAAVTIFVVLLTAAGTAAHGPVDDTIETSGTVTDDDYRYYLDQGQVAYPATIGREQVDGEWVERANYENTSVERFAAMQGNDMAADKLEEHLKEALSVDDLQGISIGSTGHDTHHFAIQALYIQPGEDSDSIAEPVVSYEELQDALPGDVEVTVTFTDHTETVVFPVTHDMTTAVEDLDDTEEQPKEAIDIGAGSQSGGTSDGSMWNADFTLTNASCWSGDSEEGVSDVEYAGEDAMDGERTIQFRGTIAAGTPCHDAGITHVEQDGNTYTINVTTERSDEVCVDCVGSLTYDASFTADDAFRLRILHDGDHVDTLDYPGYTDNGQDPADEPRDAGVFQRLLNWLTSLF